MNLKLPPNGHIYTLTVGPNHGVSDQSMPAFVQSHSRSQARLMFVTTLEMDNFDYTKNQCTFQNNSQLVNERGSFTSGSMHC